jgi:hypothetical protein
MESGNTWQMCVSTAVTLRLIGSTVERQDAPLGALRRHFIDPPGRVSFPIGARFPLLCIPQPDRLQI